MSKNWAGNVTYHESSLAVPTSVDELRQLVAGNDRVRAVGTRHSFSTIADTDGVLVDVSRLNTSIEIDRDARTATVPAGLPYSAIVAPLHAAGLALRNMGSLPHISVAGAAATGTHGSGDGNRVLASSVSALDIVTANGDLVTVDRSTPDFDGMVVSLGMLGVVTRVTLDLVDSFDLRQDVFIGADWDAFIDRLDDVTSSAYSTSVFIPDWAGSTVGAILVKSTDLAEPSLPAELGASIAAMDIFDNDAWTPQGGVPGPWLDRLPHFRRELPPSNGGDELQSEFFVDRRDARAALAAVREIAGVVNPALLVTELRTVAADELWMSGSYGRDTLCIHFTWKYEEALVLAALTRIEAALAPFAARPHWGKVYSADFADPLALYPRGSDFAALVTTWDSSGKFGNEYTRRILGD